MARKIGRVTVLEGTTVKWGTVAAVVIGTPIYAFARGYVEFTQLLLGGFSSAWSDFFGWAAEFVSHPIDSAALGFRLAQMTAARELEAFGVMSFFVALLIATATTWVLLEGVTRAIQ